jgi:hypothetical protein
MSERDRMDPIRVADSEGGHGHDPRVREIGWCPSESLRAIAYTARE